MSDGLLTFLMAVVVVGYGSVVSFLEERFGKFQDLSPTAKQAVNSVLTLVIPYILVFIQPVWRMEFGDPQEIITSAALLIAPGLVWLASQVAHAADKRL